MRRKGIRWARSTLTINLSLKWEDKSRDMSREFSRLRLLLLLLHLKVSCLFSEKRRTVQLSFVGSLLRFCWFVLLNRDRVNELSWMFSDPRKEGRDTRTCHSYFLWCLDASSFLLNLYFDRRLKFSEADVSVMLFVEGCQWVFAIHSSHSLFILLEGCCLSIFDDIFLDHVFFTCFSVATNPVEAQIIWLFDFVILLVFLLSLKMQEMIFCCNSRWCQRYCRLLCSKVCITKKGLNFLVVALFCLSKHWCIAMHVIWTEDILHSERKSIKLRVMIAVYTACCWSEVQQIQLSPVCFSILLRSYIQLLHSHLSPKLVLSLKSVLKLLSSLLSLAVIVFLRLLQLNNEFGKRDTCLWR